MAIKNRRFWGLLFSAIFLLWRCDADRLTGFNYQAEQVPNDAIVTGQISNVFTGEPIHRATIQMQGRVISTTRDGRYTIPYEIGEDDRLSRPATVRISARQYFTLDTQLVVFPENNTLNAKLVYGAPIILSSSIADSIVVAEIFDYQGAANIDSVFAIGTYWDDSLRVLSNVAFLMNRIDILDDFSALFQTHFPDTVDSSGLLRTNYSIRATDKDDFTETRIFGY
ncbi:MAG: hypothetical protein H6629_03435 [Calditrichae bacterium]|nr:hypothetical protein [Calditrichia bacterium]